MHCVDPESDFGQLDYLSAEGNGNLLQYSCLENSMDKGAWWAIVHGVTEGLSNKHFTFPLSILWKIKWFLSHLPFAWVFCCLVTTLCPTVCDNMDCSPSSSSVHEISQARILEWVAISFSKGILTQELNIYFLCVSCIVRGFFTVESPQKHLAFSYKHCCIFNIKYKICWFYILFLILHMQMCISPPTSTLLDCFLVFRF